jgi:type VI secretion system (T6SS) effector TldE1-like protein
MKWTFILCCLVSVVAWVTAPQSLFAAEKELVYHQSTGKVTLDDKEIGQGYSGKGEGKNKPDKEDVKNVGPIPQGLYTIGKAREYKKMPDCFDLTPDGHDAHGRTEFLIHGDSKTDPGNASEGCIILPPDVRKKIAETGVAKLRVVKD